MHSVLDVEEVIGMTCLDQPCEEGGRSLNFEAICGSKLLLITHQDDLLGADSRQEGFILTHHRSLIHDDALEVAVTERLGAALTNCGHYDRL